MLSRFRNFVYRHKRKIVIVGVIFSASSLLIHYLRKKLCEFHEAKAKEFIEKTRRIQHFESTETTCNQAIQKLFPTVLEVVTKLFDTNKILMELRKNSVKLTTMQKVDLWSQLLVNSFSRVVTLVYSSTILIISLRIQLNILAGLIYKEIDKDDKIISQDIQNNYLSFTQHFLKDGIRDLGLIIQNSTERVLKKYDFKQKLDLSDLEQIFWSIQMVVNQKLQHSLVNILFQSEYVSNHEEALLQKMLSETFDMLETDEVFDILTNHIGLGFSTTTDEVAKAFSYAFPNNNIVQQNGMTQNTTLINITQTKIPLAKLVPIIDGLTPKIVNKKPLSNTILNMLIKSEKIKMLGANTYEVFSQ